MAAVLNMAAEQHGVRYILEGHSFRTEGISPHGWFYMDAKYIETVHKQFGSVPMKTFPNLWLMRWLRWTALSGIKKIRPLYYLDYNKEETKRHLSDEYGWNWYGGHHMENRTAYFTNNYYLPRKFGIDLRYSEYSALVRSGQLGRGEALQKIAEPKPFDEGILTEILKRLEISDAEFQRLMALPRKTYRDYRTYKETFERLRPLFWMMYKLELVPKSFYLKYTRKYEDR